MAYDSPEDSKGRDLLGRWPLAVNVFDLIRSAPGEWSLRIGIYGRWGEGKTTALKFIETLLKTLDFKTVWFNPWAAQDRNQLWETLAAALEDSFAQPMSLKGKRWFSKWVRSSEYLVSTASNLHPLAKILPGIIGRLSKQLAVSKSDIEPLLASLGDKKVVIFIDDLDRAKPDLVPYLLLSLRELLELPQCAFVLALDPYVVAKSLPSTHPGWGATPEFMEKIIDFPFWLPPLEKHQISALANTQLSIGNHHIPRDVIADISDLLPRNPRQLKLFFRKLWRLKTVLDRHEEQEINWKLVLILDLIRNVSFQAAERLFANHEFLEELVTSAWAGRSLKEDKGEAPGEDKWVSILRETAQQLKNDELVVDQDKLLKLFNAVKVQAASPLNQINLGYWARLGSNPPSLTWKEFNELLKRWDENPSGEWLHKLAEEQAAKIEHPISKVMHELFHTLGDYRESKLDGAAGCRTENELLKEMDLAGRALSCLEKMVFDLHGFSDSGLGFGLKEYEKLYRHCSKWAHFLNHPRYVQARSNELKLLEQAAFEGSRFAAEMLDKLAVWREPHEMSSAQNDLHSKITAFFLPAIRKDLLERFSRKDGIYSLWGHDSHLVEKTVLFDKKYGFYTPENIRSLRSMAQIVTDDYGVQANFLEYLSMLAYGFKQILNPLSPEDLRPLAVDKEVIGMAWGAATARRLQPRALGSLEETRKVLEEVGGFSIPAPKWASDSIEGTVKEQAAATKKDSTP